MSGCSSTSSSSRRTTPLNAIANFAVFLNGCPRVHRATAVSTAVATPIQSAQRAAACAKSVYGPKPRATSDASAALSRTADPTAVPAVTPSSAIAAAAAADASATPAIARPGGSTTPPGVSVSRSIMTPSLRGSPGPGTNVDDDRIEIVTPLCARAAIGTRTSAKSRAEACVSTGTPSTKNARSGCGPVARAPRTLRSSVQSTCRSMSSSTIVIASLVQANVRPLPSSRSAG